IMAGALQDRAKRIADEGAPPEFQAGPWRTFMTDPVDRRDVDAVRQRVGALNQLPGLLLGRPLLLLFPRVPADRRRVKQDLRPLKGCQPGCLRIPLVPADEHPNAATVRLE